MLQLKQMQQIYDSMGRYYYYFIGLSIILMTGFLWSTNKNIHQDFQYLQDEVQEINASLLNLQIDKGYMLQSLCKKKKSFAKVEEEFLEIRDMARLKIETKDKIPEAVYDYDLSILSENANPFFKLALGHKDQLLAQSYLHMALVHRLDTLIDSLQFHKKLTYHSKLITYNEPETYHLNQVYPLYFDIIHQIEENDVMTIKHNGSTIYPNDFPFVYEEDQSKSTFELIPIPENFNFHRYNLTTRNHTIQP